MTDNEYNEAKKLVAELGSMNKASKAMGIPYPTFRRQYLRREQAQNTPQSVPESQTEPEPDLLPPGISEAILKAHRKRERHRIENEAERGNLYAIQYLQSHPQTDD